MFTMDEGHSKLQRYINGGCLSSNDILLSCVSASFPFYKNASAVIKDHRNVSPVKGDQNIIIDIPPYEGRNPAVRKMIDSLQPYREFIFAAILHGSLATHEENEYSDFDAVLILRDAIFSSARKLSSIAKELNELRSIMQEADPLQHHGWFVLTEGSLSNYDESFLPVATLDHSCSLLESQSLSLKLSRSSDFKDPFHKLCSTLEKKFITGVDSMNMFALKSFMSEFLMLPSLYIQARDKKGIFKKNSFAEMQRDFEDDDFEPINKISSLRENWRQELTTDQKKYLLRTDCMSWHRRKVMIIPVPESTREIFSQAFIGKMKALVSLAKIKTG